MSARLAERHVHRLTAPEAERLRSVLDKLVREADVDTLSPDELVCLAAAVPAALPPHLLRALHRYRSGGHDVDVMLIRDLPVDATPGPTPSDSTATLDSPGVQAAAVLLLGIVLLVGEPFNFRTFYRGRLVQHVVPVPRMEFTQTGESSSGMLDWHVEDGFSPERCDYFGLLCVRGDDSAVTEFAAARDLRLPEPVRDVLSQPRFQMWPDTAHVLDRVVPTGTTVLTGRADAPEICYDAHYLTPDGDDDEAARALAVLRRALDDARTGHVLTPGDLMILDNRRVVHCRTPFQPRYDGTDRWLMRTMACACLPRYRRRSGRIL